MAENDPGSSTAEQAVVALAAQVRRWQNLVRVLILLIVVLVAFIIVSYHPGLMGNVRAESLFLRRADGELFAVLTSGGVSARPASAGSEARGGLWLYDEQGRVRAELCVDADGNPSLRLFDANGRTEWTTDEGGAGAERRHRGTE